VGGGQYVKNIAPYILHTTKMAAKKGPRPKHIPQRTCIVCRQKQDKRNLVRLVRPSTGPVVVDYSGKQNGRGAYLCMNPSCWDKVLKIPQLLQRALKIECLTEEDKAEIVKHKPDVAVQSADSKGRQ
jgi:uncharacterized protein